MSDQDKERLLLKSQLNEIHLNMISGSTFINNKTNSSGKYRGSSGDSSDIRSDSNQKQVLGLLDQGPLPDMSLNQIGPPPDMTLAPIGHPQGTDNQKDSRQEVALIQMIIILIITDQKIDLDLKVTA